MQEFLFSKLVLLFRDSDNNVQTATKEALMRIHVSYLYFNLLSFGDGIKNDAMTYP